MTGRFSHPVFALLAGQVATAGVAFAINFLSSSVMSPEQRGVLAFFIQVSYIATTIGLLGVERPYVAARTGTPFGSAVRDLDRLTRSVWTGALLLALGAALAAWRGERLTAAMLGMAAVFVVSNAEVRKVRVAYVVSRSRTIFVRNVLAVQLGLLALGLVLYLLDVSSPALWLGAYALSSGAAVVTTRRASRLAAGPYPGTPHLSRVRREGLRLLPASLGNTALLRSDRLLMPVLASSAELGVYVTVATVMEMGAWPIQQWVDASLGRLRNEAGSGGRTRLALTLLLGSAVLTAVIGLAAFAAISTFLSEDYQRSKALIPVLGAGTVLYSMTRLQQGWLIAEGRSGLVSVAETLGLVASAALYVALIPAYGALGAAVGSSLGHGLLVVATFFLRRSGRPRGDG